MTAATNMQRFFTISLTALALVVGVVGAFAPATRAETAHEYCTNNTESPAEYYACLESQTGLVSDSGSQTQTTAAKTSAEKTEKLFGTAEDKDKEYSWIMIKIMQLFAALVGIAVLALNYAVFYTVVAMGAFVNNLSAIGVTWRILRDVGNIILIFGFLAAGIATILNTSLYGWGKKMIPMLLVAAVFINFSLFFAEAIIGTGNLFATQFYTQINGGVAPTAQSIDNNKGISDKIMSQLGLSNIYDRVNTRAQDVFQGGSPWIIGFVSILLFLVLAFVLFSLAFILIARFVILVFLIIVAPIGFAGWAVPKLEGLSSKYWHELFNQTFVAPVLLLLLYVALAVITDAQFLTGFGQGEKDWLGIIGAKNVTGFASMLLSFLVAMGLLLVVLVAAKNMSAFGAGWATKMGGRLSFGAVAWTGRNTGGWLAYKAARGLRETWVGRVPLAGTGLVRGLEKIGTGSFDARGVKALGGLKGMGIDAGEAQKGGYKADLKERVDRRVKYAADLRGRELDDDEKVNQAVLQNQMKQAQKERGKAKTEQEVKDADTKYKAAERALEELESVTDKGAQRKYAKVLELGLDRKGIFNTYINFAANTESARKIRDDAKKAKADKDWSSNIKNLIKEASEEEEGGAAPASSGGEAGGSRGGPGGGSAGGDIPPGYQQNPGGSLIIPSGSGGGKSAS